MKRTALYECHLKQNAKMVHFAGWDMPLSYSGVTDEHRAVRRTAGLFDVSHMGRLELSGIGTDAFLDKLTPGPIHHLKKGHAQYSMLLNDEGGIIDDIYIYKKGSDRYLVIVNASNRKKDLRWIKQQLPKSGPRVEDRTEETALIALQGPKSWEILKRVLPPNIEEIPLRTFIEVDAKIGGTPTLLIARTGYTGEKGYELVSPAVSAPTLWEALLSAGAPFEIKAAGLGARDTLRLEMGYPLYGHEMDENTTPIEANLARFVDFKKDFIGKERLLVQQEKGIEKQLIGFELLSGGVPREGFLVYSEQKEIGKVCSGNHSPSLRKGIGMAYVDTHFCEEGTELLIDIRGKGAMAVVVKPPFYSRKR